MKFASGSRIELSVLRPKKKPAEGFTLIELMVVVTIIGILAGLAGPGVGAALREMRASNARADVIRILNHARTAPRGTGKAHLLQFDGAAEGNRGRLSVYRSDASSCLTTDWAAVIAASNNCDVVTGVNNRCVTRTDFQSFFELSGAYSLQLTEAINPQALFVCYEPAGRMFWSNQANAAGLSSNPPAGANGAFLFTLTTFRGAVGGTPIGVARQILQPYGAAARVRR